MGSTLVADGDITGIDTSGYQVLQTTEVTLTAAQFAGFSSIVSGTGTGGFIYGATGGTYDLEGKSTEAFTLYAQSNAGTTLIGDDANGEVLTASTSGADTLQAGNGKGDNLYAGGGTDKLIAGNGGDSLYIGSGVDTAIGGSGGDTFIIGESGGISVAAGTTLQGGTGQNTLIVSSGIQNISGINISGIQTLQTAMVNLTASQFAEFSSITSGGSILPLYIYTTTGGTYDLEGKSTEAFALYAQSNAGTTLIGDDANGEVLTASTSGADTLQAGNGKGDNLYAGGGTDKLIAGNGGDSLYIGSGVETVIGGSGGDTFILGESGTLGVATGTTLQGGTGQNKLIVAGLVQDISPINISGIQTLQTTSVDLTASQFAGFSAITSGGSILPLSIYASTGGTYDIEGKSTEDYSLYALSNAGTTLIGDDANGERLTASASGNDTLQAGNGTGDQLYGGGGNDVFILSNTGTATVTGGSGHGTAVFSGDEANYSFSLSLASTGTTVTVTNKSTGAVDTLTNVQAYQFADVTVGNPIALVGGPLGLLTDHAVEAAVASQMVNDTLSYSGMLTVLQDVAAQGTVTSSEFSSLQTLASLLDVSGGIGTSSCVKDIATCLIDGDPANQYWNGGGTAVALGNLAAGSSAAQLNELIGKWFLGTDLPDITGFSAQYNTCSGSLFGSGGVPLYTDANQGKLDDCYLIASLGEVALKDPGSIESMITSNGNGTYGVRFFVNGQPEYVTVNTELPYFTNGKSWANGSSLIFANGANGTPIWAELIEKAFVELNAEPGATGEATTGNVYSDIDYGGAKPVSLITGKSISSYNYASYASESAWQSAVLPIAGGAFNEGEEVLVLTPKDATKISGNFVVDHVFEVTGYDSSTGLFTLHNPWGSDYSGTNPAVTFTASMTDLYNNGCLIWVANGNAILPATLTITSAALSNQTTVSLGGTVDAIDAGLTVSIYDGASKLGTTTANSSGAWTASVTVSATGVHTLTAQATNGAGTGTSNSVADLVKASTSLSGGGQIVLFSGSGDAVTLSATSGAWDMVTGSNGTVNLTSAQASIIGGGDTVGFAGGSGNAVSLYGTAGNWDTVTGSNGSVNLSGAQASVIGGGDAIAFAGGSGDAASLYNTAGSWDTVTGSNGTVVLSGAQASVLGGGDYIAFAGGAGDAASLFNTAGSWDYVTAANAAVYLTAAQATVAGGGDYVDFLGTGDAATLTGTAGSWDYVSAANATVYLNGAQATVAGGNDWIDFLGTGDAVTLTGTAGSWDYVNAANGTVYLNGAQGTVGGGGNWIDFLGSGDAVTLTGTAGSWDYVNASNSTVYLSSAQSMVAGGGDTVDLSGSGDAATLLGTAGSADSVNGSGGTLYFSNAQAGVTGSGDTLNFSGTANTATVSGGSESFVFQPAFGQDTINGFASTDQVQLSSSDFANWSALLAHTTQSGSNTVIALNAADTITLTGVAVSSLQQSQFKFV